MTAVCASCGEANPERARFCLSCAAPLGATTERASEERKVATVLFADLVGSTALADEQDPERTRLVLTRFYDAMTDEVDHCGGTVEKFAGDAVMAAFGAVSQMRMEAEDDVEANLATPCPGNVGSLLVAAVGMVHVGDQDAAARLAAKAESIGMIGYGRAHTAKWLRLAVARQDRTEIRRLVETVDRAWLTPASWELWAALLDALAVLDDSERIEADAPPLVRPDSYVAPFAIRALGIVRNDAAMLSDAVARFETMGLDWHAQQTRTLIER